MFVAMPRFLPATRLPRGSSNRKICSTASCIPSQFAKGSLLIAYRHNGGAELPRRLKFQALWRRLHTTQGLSGIFRSTWASGAKRQGPFRNEEFMKLNETVVCILLLAAPAGAQVAA